MSSLVPFPSLPLLDRAAEFCQAMKARITGRFLTVRASPSLLATDYRRGAVLASVKTGNEGVPETER